MGRRATLAKRKATALAAEAAAHRVLDEGESSQVLPSQAAVGSVAAPSGSEKKKGKA